MYSYLHRYHAGCFADVHKHLILLAQLNYLKKKEAPFCAMDAYAGEGVYDLWSEESQKNSEHQQGIELLFSANQRPELIEQFIRLVKDFNPQNQNQYYPGSPAIIAKELRAQDKAIVIEHHPQAIRILRQQLGKNPQVHVHDRDALEAIKALVPFKEKRGLIFLDPSYEVKKEYEEVAKAALSASLQFPNGIYTIWYPLLEAANHRSMLNLIQQEKTLDAWYCEWIPDKNKTEGMFGSGVVILNPSWQLDTVIQDTFSWLNNNLYNRGQFALNSL